MQGGFLGFPAMSGKVEKQICPPRGALTWERFSAPAERWAPLGGAAGPQIFDARERGRRGTEQQCLLQVPGGAGPWGSPQDKARAEEELGAR